MASFKLTRLRCCGLLCDLLDLDARVAACLEREVFAAVGGDEETYELRIKHLLHSASTGGCADDLVHERLASLAAKPARQLVSPCVLRDLEEEEQESRRVMTMLRGHVNDGSAAPRGAAAVVCRKCGSARIVVEQKQTRSADEGFTTFFTCVDCKCRWREE